MSAATGTRIFGVKVTLDPKIIIGGLVVLAGILFWYNSGSDDSATPVATRSFNPDAIATNPAAAAPARPLIARRRAASSANERNTLRLVSVDGSRGDVDPTLRLDLLKRLSALQPSPATRSVFEVGALAPTSMAALPAIKAPIIKPTAPTMGPGSIGYVAPVTTAINIQLKYYGFVKPSTPQPGNSGLFLEGDNVLVAKEGERVNGYLVVELTPNSARLEDTNLKQGQTLPVVPVAAP